MATLGAEDQASDAAAGPSILVLNDLWRYVPAYFQTVDAVQPRSEAGRRLLERRRRQIERQQQQQQRKSAVMETEAGENQRGTLPVDQLLAYITNSASNSTLSTSTSGSTTSCKAGRKKKQSAPNSDAVVRSLSSAEHAHAVDNDDRSHGENLQDKVKKKELQLDNVTTSVVSGDDASDFVVVRRGRKHRLTSAGRPNQFQMRVTVGGHHRHKATICDALDDFSLQDDTVTTPRAERADDNKSTASTVIDKCSVSATKLPQTSPLSTNRIPLHEVSSNCSSLDNPSTLSECQRPAALHYNDVVKRQEVKSVVVDVSTESSTDYQHKEPRSRPASDIDCVQTTKSPTITNGNDVQDVKVLTSDDVHAVDVCTTSLDGDSSTCHTKQQTAVDRVVKTVSCSTQTPDPEMVPPPSTNSTAVIDVTGNTNPPQRPNPVVFLDAKSAKADRNRELLQGSLGLSFGSFDGIASTSPGSEPCNSIKATTTKPESVVRRLDAATSPIKLSPSTCSSPTAASSSCRRIPPLCRTTGSSSNATGAPVGIVPPIMHVETAGGDANVSVDENCTSEEVNHQYSTSVWMSFSNIKLQ